MQITIKIDTANAAFEGAKWGDEIAALLHEAAGHFRGLDDSNSNAGQVDGLPLRDLNGNTVGTVAVQE